MTTSRQNLLKQISICFILLLWSVSSGAQTNGYLTNRVKTGDIVYLDGQGNECFVDYRQWDKNQPLGELVGVVCYAYYGVEPYAVDGQPGWHGWIVATKESSPLAWAPENTPCYDNCVAQYGVDGVNTPWNPHKSCINYANLDTCGWQNTYRFLEYLYTGCHTTLSEAVSPAFYYLFATKNGVTDFSVKPVMDRTTWFMPSYGMLRMIYGQVGRINAALKACGGTLFYSGRSWYSSTEIGDSCKQAAWSLTGWGNSNTSSGWLKNKTRNVRAVRIF